VLIYKGFYFVVLFSDKKTGTLALIIELLDMNLYEVIKGRICCHFQNFGNFWQHRLKCALQCQLLVDVYLLYNYNNLELKIMENKM